MTLPEAQDRFIAILRDIRDETEKIRFLKWIDSNWEINNLTGPKSPAIKILEHIAEDLRTTLPLEAVLPTENILTPAYGPNSDCDPSTTAHIDEFLYNDDYIDKLVEEGKLSRHYCADCCSRNIKQLSFITHSMSLDHIQYLFTAMLPPINDEKILDVGSRLGGVLYGAYLLTKSPKIVGVEINKEFCQLQRNVIEQYKFSDRVEVRCGSIFDMLDVLSRADVIILNNVFEFFADVDVCKKSWRLLAQHIKSGALLVTIPHISETFKYIEIGFDWREWVSELPLYNAEADIGDPDNHLQNIKHYQVKQSWKGKLS